MSPTLTGIAACIASASATVTPVPTSFLAPAVDFEGAAGAESEAAAGAKVHVRSPRPVELFVVTGEATGVSGNGSAYAVAYERVCDAPCDVRVSPRPDYFIKGHRVTPSKPFRVRDGADVTLDVRPGRPALRWLGWASVVAGLSMVTIGATMTAALARRDRPTGAGPGLIAGGSILTAGSIPLFIFGRTKVTMRR